MEENNQHPRHQDFNIYTSGYPANIINFYNNVELDFIKEELTFYIGDISNIVRAISGIEESIDPIKELRALRLVAKKSNYEKKIIFLENKLHELGFVMHNDHGTVNFELKEKQKLPAAELLFDGKKLNVKERYIIANQILGMENVISKLNIGESDKAMLIAYIFGINIDTAKNLKNNSYQVRAREKELLNYTNKLKGVD